RAAGTDEPEVRHRHARAYAAVAEQAADGMLGPDVGVWLNRLHAEHENLRAALQFAAADGDAATALALCGSWRYWTLRGNPSEGRALAELALASGDGPPELRLRALNATGVLASEQGDFAAARRRFAECLDLAPPGSPARVRAAGNLGILALYNEDFDEAIRRYEQSAADWRALGDDRSVSLSLQNL